MKPQKKIKFTRRQRDVAALVSCGQQRKTIADGLKISVQTVDYHLEKIRLKLGVVTTAHAGILLQKIRL